MGIEESKSPVVRNYAEEELNALYSLGRFYLELGQLRSAEQIFRGLIVVAPAYIKSYLGLLYVLVLQNQEAEAVPVLDQAKNLLKQKNQNDSMYGAEHSNYSVEVFLFEAIVHLTLGELVQAGTALGEVNELVERGALTDPAQLKIFKSQLARYQSVKSSALTR